MDTSTFLILSSFLGCQLFGCLFSICFIRSSFSVTLLLLVVPRAHTTLFSCSHWGISVHLLALIRTRSSVWCPVGTQYMFADGCQVLISTPSRPPGPLNTYFLLSAELLHVDASQASQTQHVQNWIN